MPYPDIANVTVDFSGHSPAADGKIRGFKRAKKAFLKDYPEFKLLR